MLDLTLRFKSDLKKLMHKYDLSIEVTDDGIEFDFSGKNKEEDEYPTYKTLLIKRNYFYKDDVDKLI